jgi:hypothetical protein
MVNNEQIKLMQVAAKVAGLRTKEQDGRYYLILAQYRKPNGAICVSCKDLNNYQIDDFLAICESMGWRYPGKTETYCRDRVNSAFDADFASYAQRQAIDYLAGDLGMGGEPTSAFIRRMTRGRTDSILQLAHGEAYKIIEALKAAISRQDGVPYENLNDIFTYYNKDLKHGEKLQTCPI